MAVTLPGAEDHAVDVAANLRAVQARIERACLEAGRPASSVRLLPVTKTKPAALIDQALAAGHHVFGENTVQELAQKAAHYAGRDDVRWALIGHLQTNKARDAARHASEFHALASVRLAEELQRRLEAVDRTLEVWIQVNSSGETTKFGLPPEQVTSFARALAPFDRLVPRGLMTLAVDSDDRAAVSACFAKIQELQRDLRDQQVLGCGWDDLSMGMSGDLELAISHGATTVRIGTAIFGGRG